jgi:DNA-binding CsgD family transcriptional regulator
MDRSKILRLTDVRSVFRLVGECRELGRDPEAWRRHSFEGLCRLLGASSAAGGEHRRMGPGRGFEFVQPIDHGFSDSRRALFAEFMRMGGPNHPAMLPSLLTLSGLVATRTRRGVFDERTWNRSELSPLFKEADVNDLILSVYNIGDSGLINSISLHRGRVDPDFSPRDRRLVHLFHQELGRLIGAGLATAAGSDLAGLPHRVRQTLDCLLDGDSEKQVALRLGLCRATVHQYVTDLYRRLGVSSRAELLSRFVRLGP